MSWLNYTMKDYIYIPIIIILYNLYKKYVFILDEYSKHYKDIKSINIINTTDTEMKLYFKFNFIGINRNPIIINAESFQLLGDNYFTNYIKFENKQIIKDKTNIIEIKIEDDYKAFKSMIESIKFNTNILVEDVNIDIILELIKTYCLDMEDIKVAFESMRDSNIKTITDIKTKCTLKCVNCKSGYKEATNNSDSCNFHSGSITEININNILWDCCGDQPTSGTCVEGYHILDLQHFEQLKKLYKIV
jgi:hypothetical protein